MLPGLAASLSLFIVERMMSKLIRRGICVIVHVIRRKAFSLILDGTVHIPSQYPLHSRTNFFEKKIEL